MTSAQRVCETIEKVRGHLEGNQIRVEADVRSYVLSPLLRDLGWDPEDPGSVKREYPVTGGKSYFFDYALLAAGGAVSFVIEAKAPGKLDADARDQLLLYAMKTKTHLGLTTDGEIWSFYLPLGGGSSEERLVRTVNLTADRIESAGNFLLRYLARDRVLSGRALAAASGDLASLAIHRVVETGWADLLAGSNDKLTKTIAAAARAAATRKGVKVPTGRALNKEVRAFIQHGFRFPDMARVAGIDAPDRQPLSLEAPRPAGRRRRSPASPKTGRGVSWTFRDETRTVRNHTEVYVAAIGRLYELRRSADFYQRLQERIRGRKRTQIARTAEGTGVPAKHVRSLPGGWHISTNLSTADKLRNLERACAVAGVAFGSELAVHESASDSG